MKILSADSSSPPTVGPASILWNSLSPSWFKNVILMLTAFPAPQPESRKISCAWAKFSAASRALVKK